MYRHCSLQSAIQTEPPPASGRRSGWAWREAAAEVALASLR